MISPWVVRLLLIQLALMYCSSGLCKFSGDNWRAGNSLYYVLNDLSLTRISTSQFVPPYWVLQVSTWGVLAWEMTFPLLILFRRTYVPALLIGVSMHLGIFMTMEIGAFPLYVLAAYVPLLMEAYDDWSARKLASSNHDQAGATPSSMLVIPSTVSPKAA